MKQVEKARIGEHRHPAQCKLSEPAQEKMADKRATVDAKVAAENEELAPGKPASHQAAWRSWNSSRLVGTCDEEKGEESEIPPPMIK